MSTADRATERRWSATACRKRNSNIQDHVHTETRILSRMRHEEKSGDNFAHPDGMWRDSPSGTHRSTADSECWSRCSAKDKMTTFNEIVKWYRLNRQTMPPPHPGLTRKEAVLYRQLHMVSLLTPVLAKHVCPSVYASDVCRLCAKERATAAHILWDCSINPREASEKTTIPPQLEAATRSYDQDTQLKAVQQVSAATTRNRGEGGQHPQEGSGGPLRSAEVARNQDLEEHNARD
ncbi:uncharacterized protein LOC142590072 [Dermacentor variabilis]|uniref:uncharacterized protein LOC142580161 n=1 Tax=Dermacentor variabilis TaxID=34621 RepID=UPI003F5C0A5D